MPPDEGSRREEVAGTTGGATRGVPRQEAGSGEAARLDATVHGSVQGVGYRAFVARTASRLGLVGWVANLPDGGVECVAEGPRRELERLLADLREGPPFAGVEHIDARWTMPAGGFTGFGIRAYGHRGD